MAWKKLKKRSLTDNLAIERKAMTEFDGAHEQDDWTDETFSASNKAKHGKLAWLPLMIFKVPLLQSWYG